MLEQHVSQNFQRKIVGIDRITLLVNDLKLAEQFYVEILGGKILFRVYENQMQGENHQNPQIAVAIANSPRIDLVLQSGKPSLSDSPRSRLAFQVRGEELRAWQVFLEKNGILTEGIKKKEFLGKASLYFDDPFGNPLELCASHFFDDIDTELTQQIPVSYLPEEIFDNPSSLYQTYIIYYQQRWELEIVSRFHEAKKRFPEFFPCFELLEIPQQRLLYSIHFQPLTGRANTLVEQNPTFPHQKLFKSIEKLWEEDGINDLDRLFLKYPTQLSLLPPKPLWTTKFSKLLLEFSSMELKPIETLLSQQK
jgi:catechol 2,3-dioxygenase-like lactoylglutathione lyase family enzyme